MHNLNPAWKPDEDPTTIHSEELWLQGAFVTCVSYGVVATLSIQCLSVLVRNITPSARLKKDLPLVVFVVATFIVNTIFIGAFMLDTQRTFVNQRNFPGGPSAYESDVSVAIALLVPDIVNSSLVVSTSAKRPSGKPT